MKNALVTGATNFVGFSLCQRLIRREVEVWGLEFQERKFELEEDKLMEIGRNAFFHYQDKVDGGLANDSENFDAAFFCLDAEVLNDKGNLTIFSDLSRRSERVFLIAPHSLAKQATLLQKHLEEELHTTLVIHPAVFGPWQPESEAIQRRLIEELQGKSTNEKLEMEKQDILYVADLAETLVCLAEKAYDKQSRILRLANKDEKALESLARILDIQIGDRMSMSEEEWENHAELLYVDSELSLSDALSCQKIHTAKRMKIDSI